MLTQSAPGHAYCPPYTPMVEVLQPLRLQDGSRVEYFEVTEQGLQIMALRDLIHERGEFRDAQLGKYVRLIVDGRLIMSDAVMERRTCLEVLAHARGDVLIGGLGLGMVLVPLVALQRVKSITVVEIDPRVVNMVWPQLCKLPGFMDKVELEQADMLQWWPVKLKTAYDAIWFDIWPDIPTAEDRPAMALLHRRWCKRLRPGGWMSSWRKGDAYARH